MYYTIRNKTSIPACAQGTKSWGLFNSGHTVHKDSLAERSLPTMGDESNSNSK